MRLFASVYLTLSLASLLGASACQTSEDRRTRRRAVEESAGLLPSAYWAGTAALLTASFAFGATCLVTVAVFFGSVRDGVFRRLDAPGDRVLHILSLARIPRRRSRAIRARRPRRRRRAPGPRPGAFRAADVFRGVGRGVRRRASLLSPVAFAASMDVAVQAEAGRDPLTLANFASSRVGRDVASGGVGGTHPMTAAGASV